MKIHGCFFYFIFVYLNCLTYYVMIPKLVNIKFRSSLWDKCKNVFAEILLFPIYILLLIITFPFFTLYNYIEEKDEQWCLKESKWLLEHNYNFQNYGYHANHWEVKKWKKKWKKEKNVKK